MQEQLSRSSGSVMLLREYGSAVPIMLKKPNCETVLFQQLAPMKSSQSALEPLELEPLELRLLPELELSLPTTPGDVVSAAAERSARAMKRSLLTASMQVSGFSLGIRETRRET